MTTLNIADLNTSQALDMKAMNEVTGRGEWHQRSSFVTTGAWSGYSAMYYNYVGTTFHDGYLVRQYDGGYKRTRTQTEYSYWDHFVRI
jgi:hypothetical protein